MKKFLVVLMVLSCFSLKVFSQDIIVKSDNSEIKAKVLEVTDKLITYKKFDMVEGPSYSVKTTDVEMIKYQNGTVKVIEKLKPVDAPSKTAATTNKAVVTKLNEEAPKNTNKRKTVFGIQGGVLSAACYWDNLTTTATPSAIVGFKGGFLLDIPLGRKFTFSPASSYVSKGGKETVGSTDQTLKLNFIEMPLNFVFTNTIIEPSLCCNCNRS